ncbi:MAG: hypothetical protein MUP80_01760 [Acidobacteriia bacterium]|nr:hypothetical protein [Terriglobia bacterium]
MKPLVLHFLNVGKGDCTIIEHPSGRVSMVDINATRAIDPDIEEDIAKSYAGISDPSYLLYVLMGGPEKQLIQENIQKYVDALTHPLEYYLAFIGPKPLFRFIATHPDMDHLSGLREMERMVEVGQFPAMVNYWDTYNHETKSGDFGQYDKADWLAYKRLRESEGSPRCLRLRRGQQAVFYNKDESGGRGDNIYVWAPSKDLEDQAPEHGVNSYSYVLLLEHGKSRIVLGGDADADTTWESLRTLYPLQKDIFENISILKASHHGLKSGYHKEMVEAMSPRFTVVSTGKKNTNDASTLYSQYSPNVLSTRWWGNICAVCWEDGDIWLYTQNDREDAKYIHKSTGYFRYEEKR